jgi:oxygen-independent coproporphyrinogen-3 oxidase
MDYIKQNFGDNRYTFLMNESSKFIDSRQLAIENNKITLTKKGQFVADNIMSDLMII